MGKLGGLAVGAEPAEAAGGGGGSVSARQGAERQWEGPAGTGHGVGAGTVLIWGPEDLESLEMGAPSRLALWGREDQPGAEMWAQGRGAAATNSS